MLLRSCAAAASARREPPKALSWLPRSCRRVKFAEDIAVAAVAHIVGHPPYIDGPGKAEYANANGRGVRAADVTAPVPAVAEDGDSADVDVHALRNVDIDVTECRENGHRRLPLLDSGFAQIEVEISESTGRNGPPAQP